MGQRDQSPVYYREIQKHGYLKRMPDELGSKLRPLALKKPPLKPMWTQLCVHNGRSLYVEQYKDPVSAHAHKPAWRASLATARHVTASVTPRDNEYDFLIDTHQGSVRMLAPTWECMQDWVTTLRSKLHELKIVPLCENVYMSPPAAAAPRAAARDPTSPLPPTPPLPVDRVPGIDLASVTRPPPIPETPPETSPEPLQEELDTPPVDISNWDDTENSTQATSSQAASNQAASNQAVGSRQAASNQAKAPASLANICGQNICLDDSLFKRSGVSDDEDCDSDSGYRQSVMLEEINGPRSCPANITVISVSDKDPPHSAPPSETRVFFASPHVISIPSDYGTVFNDSIINGNHTTVTVDPEGLYERLCMAQTEQRHIEPYTSVAHTERSHNEPYTSVAHTERSHNEPYTSVAHTERSHNEPYTSVAHTERSHNEPYTSVAHTERSHNEPYTSVAHTERSHNEPYKNVTYTESLSESRTLNDQRLLHIEPRVTETLFQNESHRSHNEMKLAQTESRLAQNEQIIRLAQTETSRISAHNEPQRIGVTQNEPQRICLVQNDHQRLTPAEQTRLAQNEPQRICLGQNDQQRIDLTQIDTQRVSLAQNEPQRALDQNDQTRLAQAEQRLNQAQTELRPRKSSLPNLDSDSTYEYLFLSDNRERTENNTSNNNTASNTSNVMSNTSNVTSNTSNVTSNTSNVTSNTSNVTVNYNVNSVSIVDSNARGIRANIERTNSERSRRAERSERLDPEKPVWRRGLTELSLLGRLRLRPPRRADATRDNDTHRDGVVARSRAARPEPRDTARRRSSSLSNGESPRIVNVVPSALQSLRNRQAAALEAAQRRGAALVACVSVADPPLFADYEKQVWIAWWGGGGSRVAGRVGDRVVGLRGAAPKHAAHARQLVHANYLHPVDILFHRVPLAKIYVITKKDKETIGIKLDGECNIVAVDPQSPAARVALPPAGKWAVTEVNNRPINLIKGGEEEMNRICLNGTEASVLIQPSALVKRLRSVLKGNRTLLGKR